MKTENKIYNAADFAAYYAGTMPPAEMHVLEKAALEDPFLSDALEGYALSASPERDVAEIRTTLAGKTEKSKVFFLSPNAKNGWLRIAATLFIFAGISYLFFSLNSAEKQNPIAKINNAVPIINTDSPAIGRAIPPATGFTDTAINTGTSSYAYIPTKKIYRKNQPGAQPLTALASAAASDSMQFAGTAVTSAETQSLLNPSTDKEKANGSESKSYLVKGNVTDEKGEPIKGAAVKVAGNIAAVTDQNGTFKIAANAPVVNASVSSSGYAKKDMAMKSEGENNLSLGKQQEYASNNNAYYRYKNRDSKDDNSSSLKQVLQRKAAAPISGDAKMEPVDSVVFTEYAAKNIKEQKDADSSAYEGEVILSFTVNKKGDPENIRTEQSLCDACDKQATALLKNGPKWICSFGKRKRVSIEFEKKD